MPNKPIEPPPEVAKAFVRDLRAFFAAGHKTIKADEIAARQLHALCPYQGPREKKRKLTDVKEMFLQMRDQAIRRRLNFECQSAGPRSSEHRDTTESSKCA